MAVVIRLARAGAKKKPYYHIVAADSRMKRDGRRVEALGTYDPRTTPPLLTLNLERVEHFLATGATPSSTVGQLIRRYKKSQAKPSEARA